MNLELENKTVLITGSSRGIGYGIAKSFITEGARVFITSRDINTCRSAALSLGEQAHAFACDFTKEELVQSLSNKLKSLQLSLDILICNVGSGAAKKDPLPSEEELERVLNLNLKAAVNAVRVFYPFIKERSGSILFISSIAGLESFDAPVSYCMAKAALNTFAKNLSRTAAADGVRVNTIAPGNVFFENGSWDLKQKSDQAAVAAMLEKKVPLARFGTPEEIGAACAFLCSQRSGFTTGSLLTIDGGQSARI